MRKWIVTLGSWPKKYKVGKWIFQIISNPLNSIDVDKFDYLLRDTQAVGLKLSFNYSRIIGEARVIDKKICYSSQCSEDIYHMFFIRYRLYRQIYNHKAVKAIEILIIKILFELEKEYKITTIGLTATSDMATENIRHELNLMFPFYYCDATTLKTMVRSNPGVLLIQNGVIINKWAFRALPSAKEIATQINK